MAEDITDAIGAELLFENDRVRVWSITLDPEEATVKPSIAR